MKDIILDENEDFSLDQVEYAGFWIRFVAYFIDSIIVGVLQGVVVGAMIFLTGDSYLEFNPVANLFVQLAGIGFGIFYFGYMESSEKQATLGKMVVGIKVINEYGGRISLGNAIGRYFAKILSGMILFIGFIMAGFDRRKQGLHDKLANTYVIRNY